MPNIYDGISGEKLVEEVNSALDLRGGLNTDGSRGGEQIVQGIIKDGDNKNYYAYSGNHVEAILNSNINVKRDINSGEIIYDTSTPWYVLEDIEPLTSVYQSNCLIGGTKQFNLPTNGLTTKPGIQRNILRIEMDLEKIDENDWYDSNYYNFPRITFYSDSNYSNEIGRLVCDKDKSGTDYVTTYQSWNGLLPLTGTLYVRFDFAYGGVPFGYSHINKASGRIKASTSADINSYVKLNTMKIYHNDVYVDIPEI